MQLAEMKTGCC